MQGPFEVLAVFSLYTSQRTAAISLFVEHGVSEVVKPTFCVLQLSGMKSVRTLKLRLSLHFYFLTLVLFTFCTCCILRCLVCTVVRCLVCIVVSCLVFIVVVVFCVLLSSYEYLLYYVCIAVFTFDAGLLARSQYSEGPTTGHLETGFSWFPCVYNHMLRWFPRFQVATTCFSCNPPDLNLLVTNFIFCVHVK